MDGTFEFSVENSTSWINFSQLWAFQRNLFYCVVSSLCKINLFFLFPRYFVGGAGRPLFRHRLHRRVCGNESAKEMGFFFEKRLFGNTTNSSFQKIYRPTVIMLITKDRKRKNSLKMYQCFRLGSWCHNVFCLETTKSVSLDSVRIGRNVKGAVYGLTERFVEDLWIRVWSAAPHCSATKCRDVWEANEPRLHILKAGSSMRNRRL